MEAIAKKHPITHVLNQGTGNDLMTPDECLQLNFLIKMFRMDRNILLATERTKQKFGLTERQANRIKRLYYKYG